MHPDVGLAVKGEWECMECGYIEVGVKMKPLEVCPDCGAPAQALEFFPYEDDWNGEPSDNDDLLEDEDLR